MSNAKPTTVARLFANSAQAWPTRPLLNLLPETAGIYGIDAGEITYDAAKTRIDAISLAFSDAGYQAGERVLLLLENRPEFFLYWLALNRLGLSVVPVNPDLRLNELEYLIGHAEPTLAITLPDHRPLIEQACRAAGIDLPVIVAGNSIPQNQHPNPVARLTEDAAEREAAVLYTSGTTGQPKGCVLSNNYFLLAGQWYASTGGLCALSTDGERMITPLPVFHMNAMAYSFMAMLSVGGCLTCLDRFHPRSWWHSVAISNATCLHYLGVMPSMLMRSEPDPQDRAHKVRFGFGAGIDPTLHQSFETRFGFPLVEAWAMTETGAGAVIAANHPPRRVGQSCIGRPSADIEVRLVDNDNQDVALGSPGELLVRRAGAEPRLGFFSEYYKDPEATTQAWRDSWFHTGDMVKQDADGGMVFVDRKKNVIRRSGENIAAVEVESTLMQHPDIAAAAVTAVPDAVRGDEVFACLQVHANPSSHLAHQIVVWCLGQLAYYKAPGYIAFVDSLPLTSTQKIQRGELKQLAAELVNHSTTICTTALKKRQRP